MRIAVSARLLTFPKACVCCMESPDTEYRAASTRTTGKKVVRHDTRFWEFPYCSTCAAHKSHADNAAIWLGVMIILAVITAVLAWVNLAPDLGPLVSVGAAVCLIALGVVLHRRAMAAARGASRPGCATLGKPVEYRGWQGSVHLFDIVSSGYSEQFAAVNRRKLVG